MLNDPQSEVKAYESLAVCHFYLTDLRKCSYYLTRTMKGIIEPAESEIRVAYQAHRQTFNHNKKVT